MRMRYASTLMCNIWGIARTTRTTRTSTVLAGVSWSERADFTRTDPDRNLAKNAKQRVYGPVFPFLAARP